MSVSLGPTDGVLVETVSHFSPLGIRFWDAVLDTPVTSGLEVTISPVAADYRPLPAVRSRSGIFVFNDLPGLQALERPFGGRPVPPVGSMSFVITVFDKSGEFSPVVFGIKLPLSYRGLFLEADPQAGGGVGRMYLLPARTRQRREGMAAISVDLWDREFQVPASFAVLAVTLRGETRFALADDQGRAMVLFPWPSSDRLQLGSPPGASQGDIYGQTWPVTVEAQYNPNGFSNPLGDTSGAPDFWRRMPGLKSVLGQPPALLWPDNGGPATPALNATLTYARDLVLRTGGQPDSRLMISRGTSPP